MRLRLRAAAAGRAIGDARVADAVGQAFDRLVAAVAEVLGARRVDRPAAFALAELKQSTAAPVGDRDLLGARLLARKGLLQHFLLGEDIQARAPRAPGPRRLGARELGGAPELAADHVAGPRQAEPAHLADHGVAGHPDLAGDLTAGQARMEELLQELDAFRTPGRSVRRHVPTVPPRLQQALLGLRSWGRGRIKRCHDSTRVTRVKMPL